MATVRELKELCVDDANFLLHMDQKEEEKEAMQTPNEDNSKSTMRSHNQCWCGRPKELPEEQKDPKELPKELPKAAKVALLRGSLVPICPAVQSCWNA